MLSWLFPRAPVDAVEKAWVETRMQWFAEQLGVARLLGAKVVVPTPNFFSGACDGTQSGARKLMERLCDHMEIDPKPIDFEVCGEKRVQQLVGVHERGVIRVAEQQLEDPEALAAAISHELAYALVPREGGYVRTQREWDWITDLLPVFLGLGVVIANAVMRGSLGHGGGHCSCSMQPHGYLPARMLGYGLALFANVRGEVNPTWTSFLQLDTLSAYRTGHRYLRKTSDSLFTSQSAARPRHSFSTDDLLVQLKSKSASARIASLWQLQDPHYATNAVQGVTSAMNDRQVAVREEAVRTLGFYGTEAHGAVPMLLDFLHDRNFSMRCAAALTLGSLRAGPDQVVPLLAELLEDHERDVVLATSYAIRQFGQEGRAALGALLGALKVAMIRCDHLLMDSLIETLYALDTDPTERVLKYFDDDPELREQAVHMIIDSLDAPEDDLA